MLGVSISTRGMLVGVLFLGIDLAWGEGKAGRPANETGVAAIDATGTVLDAGWTRGVEETLAWTERLALDVDDVALFIDPSGCDQPNRSAGMRQTGGTALRPVDGLGQHHQPVLRTTGGGRSS